MCKDQEFRSTHMNVKNGLWTQNESQLSRDKIFPLYMKELRIVKIDKELQNRDQLADVRREELTRERNLIKDMDCTHGQLFGSFKTAVLEGKQEIITDIL